MENHFDAFSKSLAESVSRRDTLRRLGAVLAGAVLAPLALGTARAGGPGRAAQTREEPSAKGARKRSSFRANDCGTLTDCDGICVDLGFDPYNCGACGFVCNIDESCLGGVCYTVY
jgi:hypothetical protein